MAKASVYLGIALVVTIIRCNHPLFNSVNGSLSAFPSGEGGPLAVDEEVTFLKSQTLPKKSSKALLSAGL